MVIKRNLMTDLKVQKKDQMMLLEYIDKNKDQMNSVSLRTVVKLVEIYKIDRTNWEDMADVGLLKA